MNHRFLRSTIIFAACFGFSASAADVLEPGFEVSIYADGLNQPMALAFAPDGRLFVAERGGMVRIVENGVVRETPFAQVAVIVDNESGLLGLALDPDFSCNGHVYLFATVSPQEQRIIRFTDSSVTRGADAGAGGPTGTPSAASESVGIEETILRDHLPTHGVYHNGGGLKFGPDGKLYFSIGDTFVAETAQDLTTLAGKICRINRDGSTPEDNPFVTATGLPRAVYALGFRNPFRFCFAPDGRLFVMDVGSDGERRREEINVVRAGDNCGWPLVEGRQPAETFDPRFVDPIYDYHDEGSAPVGAAVYTGGQFPAQYAGNLFQMEYVWRRIYRFALDGDRVVSHTLFLETDGDPIDLIQGPDGCLYYCELSTGRILKIRYQDNQNGAADSVAGGHEPEAVCDTDEPDAPVTETPSTEENPPSETPSSNPSNMAEEPISVVDSASIEAPAPPAGLCGFGAWQAVPFCCLSLVAVRRRA